MMTLAETIRRRINKPCTIIDMLVPFKQVRHGLLVAESQLCATEPPWCKAINPLRDPDKCREDVA